MSVAVCVITLLTSFSELMALATSAVIASSETYSLVPIAASASLKALWAAVLYGYS